MERHADGRPGRHPVRLGGLASGEPARPTMGAGSAVETLSEFPPFEPWQEAGGDVAPSTPASFSVRVAASFTADPLLAGLRFWMKELEIDGDVLLAPYGQVLQSLLDPTSALATRGKGLNVVLLRVRDWLRELPGEKVGDIDFLRGYLEGTARDFERRDADAPQRGAAETLLLLCPSYGALASAENLLLRADRVGGDLRARGRAGSAGRAGPCVPRALSRRRRGRGRSAARPHRPHPVPGRVPPHARPPSSRVTSIGRRPRFARWSSWTATTRCGGAWSARSAPRAWSSTPDTARCTRRSCASPSPACWCACAARTRSPTSGGCSRPGPTWGCARTSVVAATINWQPKSQNMRTLAARLNLGLDSFVFIDDNPVECAEVRAGCPEVLTIEWPQRARARRSACCSTSGSSTRARHQGGRSSARQMYREEFRRQEAARRDADVRRVHHEPAARASTSRRSPRKICARAAQLTLRTNQFNFTTIRRDEAELQALASDGRHDVRTVRVRDRFGDYGLVGLVIAERGRAAWTLDTFLLSCRVLGRGVEHRIAADLGRDGRRRRARGHVRLRVDYTKRNTPARHVPRIGRPGRVAARRRDRPLRARSPPRCWRAVHFEPSAARARSMADEAGAVRGVAAGRYGPDLRGARSRSRAPPSSCPTWRACAPPSKARRAPAAPAPSSRGRRRRRRLRRVCRGAACAGRDRENGGPARGARLRLDARSSRSRSRSRPIPVAAKHAALRAPVGERDRGGDRRALVRPTGFGSEGDHRAPPAPRVRRRTRHAPPTSRSWACTCAAPAPTRPTSSGRSSAAAAPPCVLCPLNRDVFLHALADTRPHWAGLLDDVGALRRGVLRRVAARGGGHGSAAAPLPRSGVGRARGRRLHRPGPRGWHRACSSASCTATTATAPTIATGGDSPYRCWEGFSLANRLSQLLGFHGPSLAVDTACSSSGTALHLACRALRAGECRVAVVGGREPDSRSRPVRVARPARHPVARRQVRAVRGRRGRHRARRGRRRRGARARSTTRSRRGDRIYGVIKGTALSTGNGTVGFTAPNPQAQAEAIRRSLRRRRVDPRTISYVETHGTGTALGDPIEVRGLTLGYSDAVAARRVDARSRTGARSARSSRTSAISKPAPA